MKGGLDALSGAMQRRPAHATCSRRDLVFTIARGIGGDVQADLFWWRYRLGFLTLAIERNDTLPAYRKLRDAIEDAIWREGR